MVVLLYRHPSLDGTVASFLEYHPLMPSAPPVHCSGVALDMQQLWVDACAHERQSIHAWSCVGLALSPVCRPDTLLPGRLLSAPHLRLDAVKFP